MKVLFLHRPEDLRGELRDRPAIEREIYMQLIIRNSIPSARLRRGENVQCL